MALQHAASFHCLVEEWKDCQELKPKPKEKWIFVNKKFVGAEADRYRCVRCEKRKQMHEDARKMYRTKILVKKFGKMVQGEVLIWCRKCSGYARQRMGPELMNCCGPEQMGTKEFGKLLKRIETLEERRVPARETKNWRIEENRKELREKSIRGF